MTEEEIIAWLSQARAPIRRDGVMSRDEVAEAVTNYLGNGLGLFEDALLLCRSGRVPRAAALVVLGLEEIGKVPLLVNTYSRPSARARARVRKPSMLLMRWWKLRQERSSELFRPMSPACSYLPSNGGRQSSLRRNIATR